MAGDTKSEKNNKATMDVANDCSAPSPGTENPKLVWAKPVLKMLPIEQENHAGKPLFSPPELDSVYGPTS